jgi:putative hemolysin
MDGKLSTDEIKEVLEIDHLPEDDSGSYQTLGGFVMLQIGRVPVAGDRFESSGFTFEVMDMDDKRVDKVLVTRAPEVRKEDEANTTEPE